MAVELGGRHIHNPYLLRLPLCHTPASHVRCVICLSETLIVPPPPLLTKCHPHHMFMARCSPSSPSPPGGCSRHPFPVPPYPPPHTHTTHHVSPTAHVCGTMSPVLCCLPAAASSQKIDPSTIPSAPPPQKHHVPCVTHSTGMRHNLPRPVASCQQLHAAMLHSNIQERYPSSNLMGARHEAQQDTNKRIDRYSFSERGGGGGSHTQTTTPTQPKIKKQQ